MKSFVSRSLVLSVLVCTFVFGAFVSATEVKAQTDSSVCSVIKTLITAGIISADKANAALVAAGCENLPADNKLEIVIVNHPTLSLTYGNDEVGGEVSLQGKLNVTLKAVGDDVYIYANQTAMFSDNNGHVRYVGAGLTDLMGVNVAEDFKGLKVFKLSAGQTVSTTIAADANTNVMFAGNYHFEVPAIMYSNDLTGLDIKKVDLNAGQSNGVLIVGETSPYITAVNYGFTGESGLNLIVLGDRLSLGALIIDGQITHAPASMNSSNKISFFIKLDEGRHSLQISDTKAGNSNVFWFDVSTVQGGVHVSYPKGGSTWSVGSYMPIQWEGIPTEDNVQIGLIDTTYDTEGGDRAEQTIVYNMSNTGSYNWQIPKSLNTMNLEATTKSVYEIVVHSWSQTNPISGFSDSFSIIGPVAPKPTVALQYQTKMNGSLSSLMSSGGVLPKGTDLILTWKSTGADKCQASASPAVSTWNSTLLTGGVASAGKVDVGRTYKVTCTGAGGEAQAKIDMAVETSLPPTNDQAAASTTPSTPKPSTPAPSTSMKLTEIYCAKGDWLGKNSMAGIWTKKDWKYNPDARFLCHTDRIIYRCTNDGDETPANTTYWNTFSTRAGDGALTPNYRCNVSADRWESVK